MTMRFKVGDKVRVTREAMIKHINDIDWKWKEAIKGTTIKNIEVLDCYLEGDRVVKVFNLELVSEEPEFEYGEVIEVQTPCGSWEKRIFVNSCIQDSKKLYLVVSARYESEFRKNQPFNVYISDSARKLKTKLTRKEIAEKFGINKDFILVEEDE